MAVKKAEVLYLGDASALIKATLAGAQAQEKMTGVIKGSAAEIVAAQEKIVTAGAEAALAAKEAGASVEAQAAAAGKAAAAEAEAVGASTAKQVAAWRAASSAAEASAAKVAESSKMAAVSAGRIGSGFAGAAKKVLTSGTAMVTTFLSIAAAKKAVDTTTELAHATIALSRGLGLTVHQASEYAAVAKVNDIQTKALTQGFGTLAKNASLAAQGYDKQNQKLGALTNSAKDQAKAQTILSAGAGTQAKAFAALGITQADLARTGNNFQALFSLVADKFQAMGGGTKRATLAMQLLGKGWQTLAPLMRGGSDGMQHQIDLANKYGVTLDGHTIKSVHQLVEAQKESKYATMGLEVAFGQGLAPVLTTVIKDVAEFVNQIRTGKGEGGKFRDAVVTAFHAAKAAISPIVSVVGKVVSAIEQSKGAATALGVVLAALAAKFVVGKLIAAFSAVRAAMVATTAVAAATGRGFGAAGALAGVSWLKAFKVAGPLAVGAIIADALVNADTAGEDPAKLAQFVAKTRAQMATATASVDKFVKSLTGMPTPKAIKLIVNNQGALGSVDISVSELRKYGLLKPAAKILANNDDAKTKIAKVNALLDQVYAPRGTITPKVNASPALAAIQSIGSALDSALQTLRTFNATPATGGGGGGGGKKKKRGGEYQLSTAQATTAAVAQPRPGSDKSLRDYIAQVWKVAAPYYGQSPASKMPTMKIGATKGALGSFVGDLRNADGSKQGQFVNIPQWFAKWFTAKGTVSGKPGDMKKSNAAFETLIHEWAHYAQTPGAFDNGTMAEGGAQAFAKKFAPAIAKAVGKKGFKGTPKKDDVYGNAVQVVVKKLGEAWVKAGQFGSKGAKGGKGRLAAASAMANDPNYRDVIYGTDRGIAQQTAASAAVQAGFDATDLKRQKSDLGYTSGKGEFGRGRPGDEAVAQAALNAAHRQLASAQKKKVTKNYTASNKRSDVSSAKTNLAGAKNTMIDATVAMSRFNEAARRAQTLAKIQVKIQGLEQTKAFNTAIGNIAQEINGALDSAVSGFQTKWEATTGKAIDDANAVANRTTQEGQQKALDAFDQGTADAIAQGPAAQALKALQDQADATAAAAQDASDQQGLKDAQASGDPRAIAAAKAQLDETAKQKAITAAQVAADAERAGIEQRRADEKQALADRQADDLKAAEDRQTQDKIDAETLATNSFKDNLAIQLHAELDQLKQRQINYATFATGVNKILADNGIAEIATSPEDETATNAPPAAPAPGKGKATTPDKGGTTTAKPAPKPAPKKKKHASGGLLDYDVIYQVNELGGESLVRSRSGQPAVRSSSMVGAGGGGGDVHFNGPVSIGSSRAARIMAERLAYRLKFG